MALPDYLRVQNGTAIIVADATDYDANVDADMDLGSQTDQIDCTSLGTNAYRQSAKIDLGATRGRLIYVQASFEWATAPTVGETVDFYWAPSPSATAANANPGGVSGSDSAYTGTPGDGADDSVKQLIRVGSAVVTVDTSTDPQMFAVGTFAPPLRYGTWVIHNNTSTNLTTDANNAAIGMFPIESVIEDS